MPQERSSSRPFQSRFGGGYVTPSVFIAEAMCERMANKDKTTLPLRFWETERWKRQFLLQVRAASSLLKLYSYEAVIRALRTPEGKRIYSLGANWLGPLIQTEHLKLEREKKTRSQQPVEPAPTQVVEKPRPPRPTGPSLLDKLRELD